MRVVSSLGDEFSIARTTISTGFLPGAGWAAAAAETDFYVLKGALEALAELDGVDADEY